MADDDVSPYTRRQCRVLQTHLQNLLQEKASRAVYRIVAFMGYGDYLDQCGADKSRAEILEALGAQESDPLRLLERLEIPFTLHQADVDESDLSAVTMAHKLGVDPGCVFKTLVARGDKTGVIMACIPAAAELNLKALATASGNKHVEMVHLKEVLPLTGYIRGGSQKGLPRLSG